MWFITWMFNLHHGRARHCKRRVNSVRLINGIHHFLNTKNTAAIRNANPTRWFHASFSSLKNISVNAINTVRVMTSWMVFNWTSEYGPPSSLKPILLAGTWKRYSKNASPQLIRMTVKRAIFFPQEKSLNRRCPYQAKVMNVLEMKRNMIVWKPFMVRIKYLFFCTLTVGRWPFFILTLSHSHTLTLI